MSQRVEFFFLLCVRVCSGEEKGRVEKPQKYAMYTCVCVCILCDTYIVCMYVCVCVMTGRVTRLTDVRDNRTPKAHWRSLAAAASFFGAFQKRRRCTVYAYFKCRVRARNDVRTAAAAAPAPAGWARIRLGTCVRAYTTTAARQPCPPVVRAVCVCIRVYQPFVLPPARSSSRSRRRRRHRHL